MHLSMNLTEQGLAHGVWCHSICGDIFIVSFISLCQSHSLGFVLFHLVLAPGDEMTSKTRGKHKELVHSGVLALISPEPLTRSVIFVRAVDLPVLCATQLGIGVKKKKHWELQSKEQMQR